MSAPQAVSAVMESAAAGAGPASPSIPTPAFRSASLWVGELSPEVSEVRTACVLFPFPVLFSVSLSLLLVSPPPPLSLLCV